MPDNATAVIFVEELGEKLVVDLYMLLCYFRLVCRLCKVYIR